MYSLKIRRCIFMTDNITELKLTTFNNFIEMTKDNSCHDFYLEDFIAHNIDHIDVNTIYSSNGYTIFTYLLLSDKYLTSILKILDSENTDVNHVDGFGNTPFILALRLYKNNSNNMYIKNLFDKLLNHQSFDLGVLVKKNIEYLPIFFELRYFNFIREYLIDRKNFLTENILLEMLKVAKNLNENDKDLFEDILAELKRQKDVRQRYTLYFNYNQNNTSNNNQNPCMFNSQDNSEDIPPPTSSNINFLYR